MPAQVFGNQALAVQLYFAFNGVAPSNVIYNNYLDTMASSGPNGLALQIGQSLSSVANATLAANVLANVGISAATTNQVAYDTLLAAAVSAFAAVPVATRGVLVKNFLGILSTLEGNATWGAAAAAFNATTLSAYTYASNPVNTQPSDASFFNTYFLTANTDIATANVFQAGQVFTPGGDDRINALQDEDVLTGTGTNPKMNATLGNANDNGATIITPSLINIQELNVAFTGSGALAVFALDLQDSTGQQEINITRISQAVNAAEVGNITTAAAELTLSNTNANNAGVAEFSYGAGVLAGAQTGNLALSNVQIGAVNVGQNTSGIGVFGVGTNGFETLNLASNGAAANVVGTLNSPMDTNTDGKVVITGTAGLTLGTRANIVNAANGALVEAAGVWNAGTGLQLMGGRVAHIDASALEGNLNLVLDNILDVGKAGTSGVVQNVTVHGGKGDDTFVLYDAIQAGDSINGGDGTDTLQFYNGSSIASVAGSIEAANMQLTTNAGNAASTVDFDFLPNATGMTLRNITNNGVTNVASGNVATFTLLDMTAAQAAAITVQHSTTGNGQIQSTVINAAVKANTAADLLGITIAEGTNVDPRFNFTVIPRVAVNPASSTTATASRFESLTLTNSDTESNSVELQNSGDFTGTITVAGSGAAGTFLSLDVDTAGGDVTANVDGADGAAAGVQQGMFGLNTDGLSVDLDSATGAKLAWGTRSAVDVSNVAGQVRLGAATINAAGQASDVIVRVGTNAASATGAQSITMGDGDDVVIFDNLNDTRAGLTISDTVAGGAGADVLVIDGNGVNVNLGASEWTNVTGMETIRLVGLGGAFTYTLTITNDLIDANAADGNLLAIVNDNDANNDTMAAAQTVTVAGNAVSAVTIDARTLNASNSFSYNGEEGAQRTADRFIFADANVNGKAVIDGGAIDNVGTANAAGNSGPNGDVLEIRNSAVATAGDLANIRNVGTIAFNNDQATAQVLTLQLNDTVVDAMVDSYHTSVATAGRTEVLNVNMLDAAVVEVAGAGLILDVVGLTGRSAINLTLNNAGLGAFGGAVDTLGLSASGGVVTAANFTTLVDGAGFASGPDKIQLTKSAFTALTSAVGAGFSVAGEFLANATGIAADANDFIIFDTVTGNLWYDADGNGVGQSVLIATLAGVADLAAGDFVIIA